MRTLSRRPAQPCCSHSPKRTAVSIRAPGGADAFKAPRWAASSLSAGRRGIEPRCSVLETKPIPDHNPGGSVLPLDDRGLSPASRIRTCLSPWWTDGESNPDLRTASAASSRWTISPWSRRESNPHFSVANAASSRWTTTPSCTALPLPHFRLPGLAPQEGPVLWPAPYAGGEHES